MKRAIKRSAYARLSSTRAFTSGAFRDIPDDVFDVEKAA